MGRKKIDIAKLDTTSKRNYTYAKRRLGIAKKAKELAILCGTKVILVTYSPKGVPELTIGPESNFNDIITKYSDLSPEQRHEFKLESLKVLQKSFKKDAANTALIDELIKIIESPKSPPRYEVELQQAEYMLQQLDYMTSHMPNNPIAILEKAEMLTNHLIAINHNMKIGITVPMPSGGNANSSTPVSSSMLSDINVNPYMNEAGTSAPVSGPSTIPSMLEGESAQIESAWVDFVINASTDNDNGSAQGRGNVPSTSTSRLEDESAWVDYVLKTSTDNDNWLAQGRGNVGNQLN